MKITKEKIYTIIFRTNTKEGRRFDIVLLWAILLSVSVIIFDSIPNLNIRHKVVLYSLEWFFTILFNLEYIIRVWSHPKRTNYIFSFWGIIDLISFLPTYLSLFFTRVSLFCNHQNHAFFKSFQSLKNDAFL